MTKGQIPEKIEIYGNRELVKGLQILGHLGTTAQFNAIGYANRVGLESADIKMIHMENGPAYQAFISGQGDALAASPPHSFQARDAGYICVATFEDATGVISMDGIYTSKKLLETQREDIVKFIKAT